MKRNHSFLPLRNRLSIFIDDLSPDRIKSGVKEARLKTEPTPSQRQKKSLNDLSKALGFTGGFDGYQKEYPKLLAFLQDHGMTRLVNLVDCRASNFGFQITHEQLAGRLFMSGLPLPEKVFTGYNFDYNRVFNHQRNAFGVVSNAHWSNGFWQQVDFLVNNFDGSLKDFGLPESYLNDKPWSMLEAFLAEHESDLPSPLFHLLGDVIIRPYQGPVSLNQFLGQERIESGLPVSLLEKDRPWSVFKAYHRKESEGKLSDFYKKNQVLSELLAIEFDLSKEGWVEIVQYNHNLVFLKGKNGDYDFVFREMRNTEPIFQASATRLDTSSFLTPEREKEFLTEYYFKEGKWRDKDMHEAYCHFYSTYDDDYPGEENLLYRFMTEKMGEDITTLPKLNPHVFNPTKTCRFDPGEIVIYSDAADYCKSVGVDPQSLVDRHITGEHGLDRGTRYTAAAWEYDQWKKSIGHTGVYEAKSRGEVPVQQGWAHPETWDLEPVALIGNKPDRSFFSAYLLEKAPSIMVSVRTDHFPHPQTSVTLKDFSAVSYLTVDDEHDYEAILLKENVEGMLKSFETGGE